MGRFNGYYVAVVSVVPVSAPLPAVAAAVVVDGFCVHSIKCIYA